MTLLDCPLGTRFFVENGCWYGKVCGTSVSRKVYVEYTGRTFDLTEDHGLIVTFEEEDAN